MSIGDRLRKLREAKNLSQGDVEKRTGLPRPYISGVENGHTVPTTVTLEKLARAFEIPHYQLFYEGDEPPRLPNSLKRKSPADKLWSSSFCSRISRKRSPIITRVPPTLLCRNSQVGLFDLRIVRLPRPLHNEFAIRR
jgi:transcriptional regulator with XRE-family HTH domain